MLVWLSMSKIVIGRGDMAESARDLGEALAADKKQWQQEILSGQRPTHQYAESDTITCFVHRRDARQRGTVYRLEVIGGLPEDMKDPHAHGNTLEQAKWRLRWALASHWMNPKGKYRWPAERARERAKRADIYIADAIRPTDAVQPAA